MIYIYDILLNFNENLIEFYEWEKSDVIYHIKKIPVFKIETVFMEDILAKKVNLNFSFLNIILNKTEVFDNKRIKTLKFGCLFTDGHKVIGALFNNDATIKKISDLLIDEARDVISISSRCTYLENEYNILGDKKIDYFLTRNEAKIKQCLIEEFNKIYLEKDDLKLKYLYFEYFNKNINDLSLIYKDLMISLNNINHQHFKLYELIKLYSKHTTSLTN